MELEAPIVGVTVYTDRARVTRRGRVDLAEGVHELAVRDLTLLLDPGSVRAGGEGTAQVRILGVDVRSEYYAETPSVSAAALKHKLDELTDADQALQDELALLDSQLSLLGTLGAHAGEHLAQGIGRGRATVSDGDALLGFLSAQHTTYSARKREIAVARRDLAAEIDVVRKELQRIQGARPRERYSATVGLEVVRAGSFALDLEYTTTRGGGWRPHYDLRLVEGAERPEVELTYMAQVQQSTGEDWGDVALVLSTARPAVSADLPELRPWYLKLRSPEPKFRAAAPAQARILMARSDDLSAGAALGEAEAALTYAQAAEATVDVSGTAVTFHIPRRVDIPADDTPHKVTVRVMHLQCETDYMTAPKLVGEVYRRAKVHNEGEVTLLPGPVSLFHGGEFIGQASLPKVAPGETFETTMGLEDRITVERELALQEVGKQFIGDRRVMRYGYAIRVQNLLPQAADLVVLDQVPVAAHEEIKVRVEEIDPPPYTQSEQGELAWRLSLAPEDKRVLRFTFSVTAPRDSQVMHLPSG